MSGIERECYPCASGKRRLFAGFGILIVFIFLGGVSKALGASSQMVSSSGTKKPHPKTQSPFLKEPPPLTPEKLARYEAFLDSRVPYVVPVDPAYIPDTGPPASPQSFPGPMPGSAADGPATHGDLTIYRNTILNDTATNNGTSRTNEPSLGVNGRAVFWSGNWYASVSDDGGQTFSYIDPDDNFPANGVSDPVNGGFCCDQVVYYDRTSGCLFWLLQYSNDGVTNTQRIAVANSMQDIVNNNWFWYDFTPSDFGLPATNRWLDFPDLTVGNNFLYYSTNIFRITGANPNQAVVTRIPLDEICAGDTINYSYLVSSPNSPRMCQGTLSILYYGVHTDNNTIKVYRWPESSNVITTDNLNHNGFNVGGRGTMVAPGPDGRDWAGFADNRILGAYRANSVLGFMWNAVQGGRFAFPQVQVVRGQQSNRNFIDQTAIWNASFAWMFPSVHPNDRGDLGGTIAFGGGTTLFPSAACWIVDGFSNTFAPLDNTTFASGASGPSGNRWGDYFTTRKHVPYDFTWAGTGYSLQGGPNNGNVVPRFVWFGRNQDSPPSTNRIHIDLSNSGYEDGSSAHPYDTVEEGNFAAQPGDTLVIQTGNYNNETFTFSTDVDIETPSGSVTVGP